MARQMLRSLTDPSGRTLMELLVSMAIVSVVSLALSSIVILGLRFARTSQFEDQRVYPVRNGFDMIVKDLRLSEGTIACGASGDLTVVLRKGDGDYEFVQYHHDSASRRVLRRSFSDTTCSSGQERAIAHQISDFALTFLGDGRFSVTLEARSNDPGNTPFRMTQEVVGRVLAGP